jgi:hypothetical protein
MRGEELMDTIPPKPGASDARMKDSITIDMERVRKGIALDQAESLKRGVPIHYSEGGRLIEKRPDGSTVEVERPVSMDCAPAPSVTKKSRNPDRPAS